MFGTGHGPGEGAERWARAAGMADGIEFVGRLPYSAAIERIAAEADVFVHPALEEAQGMVLLEAMALGLPIIAGGASGGVPWTLDEGRAGILVDVSDPGAVAGAMEMLARSEDEREDWGQRGLELANRRYHIRSVADAYERIYAELSS